MIRSPALRAGIAPGTAPVSKGLGRAEGERGVIVGPRISGRSTSSIARKQQLSREIMVTTR